MLSKNIKNSVVFSLKNEFRLENKSFNSDSSLLKYLFNSYGGLCAGLSLLWLNCMMNSFGKSNLNKNGNFYKYFMHIKELEIFKGTCCEIQELNIEWYNKIISDIVNSYHYNKIEFEKFKKHIKILFKIGSQYLPQRRIYLVEYNNMKFIPLFQIAAKIKSDHLCCYFCTESHALAVYIQKNGGYFQVYFYDPDFLEVPVYSCSLYNINNDRISKIIKDIMLKNNINFHFRFNPSIEKNQILSFYLFTRNNLLTQEEDLLHNLCCEYFEKNPINIPKTNKFIFQFNKF